MIYFLKDGNYVKIGFTRADAERRKNELQTGCARPLELIGTASGGIQTEATIHYLLRRHRHQREWFVLNDEVKGFIASALSLGIGPAILAAEHAEIEAEEKAAQQRRVCSRSLHATTVSELDEILRDVGFSKRDAGFIARKIKYWDQYLQRAEVTASAIREDQTIPPSSEFEDVLRRAAA